MLYGIKWEKPTKKTATKKAKSKAKNATQQFSQNSQDLKLGALLIKQGKVTKMPMAKLAKGLARWNASGRQVVMEDFLNADIKNNPDVYKAKGRKVKAKKAKKSVAKKRAKKGKKVVAKKKVATPKTTPQKTKKVKKKVAVTTAPVEDDLPF